MVYTASLLLLSTIVTAQKNHLPQGLTLIKESELKADVYALADAHFNGRSAGTLDELKASTWIGEVYRKLGLKPMGDDGTYFQFFNLMRNTLDEKSRILINQKEMSIWKDISVQQLADFEGTDVVQYLGNALTIDTNAVNVAGKS